MPQPERMTHEKASVHTSPNQSEVFARSIGSSETEIIGEWIIEDGRVVGDAACKRIWTLTQNELVFIANDWSGWEALYLDQSDGRYWERTHPHGELQAGGPPALRVIDPEVAAKKYRLSS